MYGENYGNEDGVGKGLERDRSGFRGENDANEQMFIFCGKIGRVCFFLPYSIVDFNYKEMMDNNLI